MKKLFMLIIILLIAFLAACSNQSTETNSDTEAQEESNEQLNQNDEKQVMEFNIVAKEAEWALSPQNTINAWTFNGTVPGEEIRVNEGDTVKVNLSNELSEPVSIHWHGYPVPNNQDGIPGVTQDAVVPGETYTYEFIASVPGTYWYHTHQNAVEQLDKGLYGTLIVEPKEGTEYDRDYTLVLDEWESGSEDINMSHGNMNMDMEGMDHDDMETEDMDHDNMNQDSTTEESAHSDMMAHDMSSYDIYTINGKTYDENEPLLVKEGEKVKLRFVNAGYMAHKIHIPVDYKVTHVDGQEVNNPQVQQGSLLEVAPGERYDIEFIADGSGNFTIDCHGEMQASRDMRIDVIYEEGNDKIIEHNDASTSVDLTNLGESMEAQFSLEDEFDLEYTMELGAKMDMTNEEMGMVWTVNGEAFPNITPFQVTEGDKVKVTLTNNSMDNSTHPMHLHGHFFQVLSKNGEPLSGSPIIKDTLNVKPGETYVVAFLADNPGHWLFHCHDLHHASNGMVSIIKYNGFEEFYKDTGKVNNQPE
jgi:FtsP/CotA-like multicopper oxidase with cupredoxin domain